VEQKGFHRKPTTILSAHAADSSRQMNDDEAAAVQTLNVFKQAISESITNLSYAPLISKLPQRRLGFPT
jgi:hypothetical protein